MDLYNRKVNAVAVGFIRITKITLDNNYDYIDYLIKTVEQEEAKILDYLKY